MFLLLCGRHVGAPRKGTNMTKLNCLPNNAAKKNREDVNLGNEFFLSTNYLSYT